MWHKANVTNITHDAETGMFEAYVTIDQNDVQTNHVVQVPGPISTPFETLRPWLIRVALDKRRKGQFEFRQAPAKSKPAELHRKLFSGPSLLDQLLGRAA